MNEDLAAFWTEYLKPTELDELTSDWTEKPATREEAGALAPAREEPAVKPFAKLVDLSDPVGKRKKDPFDDGSGSKRGFVAGIEVSF